MSEGSTAPVAAKNNTGTIALIVAGILLFVVCAMLYKDMVDSKLEKERASWGARPQQQQPFPQNQQNAQNGFNQQGQQYQQNGQQFAGQQNQGGQFQPQGQQQPPYQNQNQAGNYQQNPNQQPTYQNTGNQNYQPPAGIVGQNPAVATTPPPVDIFENGTKPPAPAPPNPELERRKQELEQRRQEQMIADQQIAALSSGGSIPPSPVQTGASTSPPSFPLASDPGTAVSSAGGTPGEIVPSGSPATSGLAYGEELLKSIDPTSMSPEKYLKYKEKVAADGAKIRAEIEKQNTAIARVQNEPAIAQVKLYDSQWNFVEINGGKDRNLSMKQRLTIRRGTKILGVIEITELGDNYAVGELKTANNRGDDSLKPQAGDDLIPAELF